jgi:hypothetical protein
MNATETVQLKRLNKTLNPLNPVQMAEPYDISKFAQICKLIGSALSITRENGTVRISRRK